MAFKLKELYDELGEVIEKLGLGLGSKVIEENEKEYKIDCVTSYYNIPELKVNVHYADLYIYEPDIEHYVLTDHIYLVFNADTKKLEYSEQGGTLHTSVYNYCRLILKDKTITMDRVDEMDCTYMLDRGELREIYENITF